MSRRAKIVCTLGPATGDARGVEALVEAGMDVARLNFSHSSQEEHARVYQLVRAAGDASGHAVGVLADLQGPKIRLGEFAGGRAVWTAGEQVVLSTERLLGNGARASVDYPGLAEDVGVGDRILVDDGNLALQVLSVAAPEIECRVVEGGEVSDHKGVSLPGSHVSLPVLSEKDLADLRFAAALGVDIIALSFVRSASDAEAVRAVLRQTGSGAGVIAKIEKPQAVSQLEEIVNCFDGIMLARGDLGVEIPLEQVPLVQKRAIRLAREAGKPVVVATQMLESMIRHARPTRAETTDVATAVFDGADALMLSAETSVGAYPIDSVETMARIIEAAETEAVAGSPAVLTAFQTSSAALARAAVDVARDVGACALVAFTQTGATARRLARHRPTIPILAFTPQPLVRSQLALTWGVETFIVPTVATTDQMVHQVDEALRSSGRAGPGDRVVVVAGTPPGQPGSTNTIRTHRLG
ncbi:MAG: pyruvate kinase [Mycobacteriales bacterium]